MLTKLDELYLHQHYRLDANDECYFGGEYTAGLGFSHSTTNQLIHNLKKGMERRGLPEWWYKERAIQSAAANLRQSLRPEFLAGATFVPVPPSKAASDPRHDNRMAQVVRFLGENVDARELILQINSMEDAHTADARPGPATLYSNYRVDQSLILPTPSQIAIVDDVLTTGAHFKAMKRILTETYPGVRLVGIFIARRVPGTE
jgi:hypothetical protein